MLTAHPLQRRQIGDDNLFLLWRDSPSGGREGLLCVAVGCGDPSCPCRDVQVRGVRVDEQLVSAEMTSQGLSLKRKAAPSSERKVTALVDIDTGEIKPAEGAAQDEALLAWLPGEMDGEMLAHLASVWAAGKGRRNDGDSFRKQSWAGLKPGEMLRWAEVFDPVRRDAYRLGEGTYFAEDLYCAAPGCPCTEMRVLFGEQRPGGEVVELGAVVVDTRTGEALRVGAPGGREALVDKLWAGFGVRHPVKALVAARSAMMKRVGQELAGLSQRSTAGNPSGVGRNDPCPCGSGKKYKRCCM